MTKHFCDRCKKEIIKTITNERNLAITETKSGYEYKHMNIYLCEECMNDFINYIEYECDRYILRPTVIISKEADDSNV